jgi:hypothetical protein
VLFHSFGYVNRGEKTLFFFVAFETINEHKSGAKMMMTFKLPKRRDETFKVIWLSRREKQKKRKKSFHIAKWRK